MSEETVPVKTAASKLRVSSARILQMLAEGKLTGPISQGRGHTRQVYRASLDQYEQGRATPVRMSPSELPHRRVVKQVEDQLAHTQEEADLLREAFIRRGEAYDAALNASRLEREATELFRRAMAERERAEAVRSDSGSPAT